jgi:hypothetical protein
VLFPSDHEADLMDEAGMMMRHGVQFHWTNPGYENFDAFLATLSQKKRKNIRAERRRVTEAGITFRHLRGPTSTTRRGSFNRCYRQTYRDHHSTPYLNLDFFRRIGAAMPEHLLLVIAEREGATSPVHCWSTMPIRRSARCTAATGARWNTIPACISRLPTTSHWSSASAKASARSKAARRANTRWRAASCPWPRAPRTGWRTVVRRRGRALPGAGASGDRCVYG